MLMAVAPDFQEERIVSCNEMTFNDFWYFFDFFDNRFVMRGIVQYDSDKSTYFET